MAEKKVEKKVAAKPAAKPAAKAAPKKAAAKPAAKPEKVVYHVSKREGENAREWKVFIQNSDKVIKLFDTQKEALDYALALAKGKADATVMLHGLDGKLRKY